MKKLLLAGAFSLLLAPSVNSATIFQQSLSGAGLISDSNVSVFESSSLTGNWLDFTGRSTARGALLRWNILGASSYNNLTVTVQLDHDALNGPDNDLFIGLSDGVNMIAPTRIDAFGGAINIFDGTVGGSAANPTIALDGTGVSTLLTSLGGVDPITFTALLPSDGSNTTLQSVQEGTATASNVSFDRTLVPNNGLQLYLFGDHLGEQYGINYLSVTVEEEDIVAVPAPGALLLLGLGMAGIGFARHKRIV
jgi:hypothetical protein